MTKSIMFLATLVIAFSAIGLVSAEVNGASVVSAGTSSRGPATSPGSSNAQAGNVTELTITGSSLTQAWQGYFGNVSGTIELTDGSGNVLYNWSLASPQGEVYASNSSSVSWTNIQCFNLTANSSALESAFGIGANDADGVNETFSDANTHAAFSTGSTSFTAGQCPATYVYDSTGAGVSGNFEEVLLDDGTNTVFASLLEDDLSGFDSKTHDFEMLVLEDGHNGDTTTTTYYFYIELN